MDFEKIDKAVVEQGANIAELENNGFILSNNGLCKYNALIILKHMTYVYCDNLTDAQAEKVINMYNNLVL